MSIYEIGPISNRVHVFNMYVHILRLCIRDHELPVSDAIPKEVLLKQVKGELSTPKLSYHVVKVHL